MGRFTGQTQHGEKRSQVIREILSDPFFSGQLQWKSEADIPEGWRLTRDEMLESPPHLLITNYAMLEHLLLLPKNESLFRQHRLKFIVLDEVHVPVAIMAFRWSRHIVCKASD